MKCCSAARAKAKRVAVQKSTKAANAAAKAGIKPKKAPPKKAAAKKAPAKKPPPCKICGKGR